MAENLRRGALFGEIHSPIAFLRRHFLTGSGRRPAADAREIAEFIGLTKHRFNRDCVTPPKMTSRDREWL